MQQLTFLDAYANLNSVVHRLDPRMKIVAFFALIFAIVLTPIESGISKFGAYFILVLTLTFFAQVPIKYVFQRSLVVLPFVVLITVFLPFMPNRGTENTVYWHLYGLSINRYGLLLFSSITIKAWLSTLSMIILTSTTKFTDLLKGLEKLKLGRIMVLIISFMYRYIFVFLEEIKNVQRAMQSRNFGGSRRWQWKVLSSLVASTFLRSYEQSERIYVAMLSRGFDGEIRTLDQMQISRIDCLFLPVVLLSILIITFGW